MLTPTVNDVEEIDLYGMDCVPCALVTQTDDMQRSSASATVPAKLK